MGFAFGLLLFVCFVGLALVLFNVHESEKSDAQKVCFEEKVAALEAELLRIKNVIAISTGGVSKRISENIEITELMLANAPELFRRFPTLAYTLHANDQFLNGLYNSTAESLSCHQKLSIEESKIEREVLFGRIYASFDLAPPNIGLSESDIVDSTKVEERF